MKEITLTLSTLLLFSFSIFAQHDKGDTLYFGSDSSDEKFAITVESLRSDDMKKFNVRVAPEASYRPNFVALSYYIPKKHYFELEAGAGVGLMGTYIFHHKEKYKEVSQSLKVEGNIQYQAKLPMYKEKNFGLRYGIGYFHMDVMSFLFDNGERFTTTRLPLTIGISRFNIKHASFKIFGNDGYTTKRRGHQLFSLNLDAVFFPVYRHKFNEDSYEVIQDENADLGENQIYQSGYDESLQSLKDGEKRFGLHASIQGVLGSWSKGGSFGFRYHLGGIFYPASGTSSPAQLNPTGGIGLVWFFDGIAL